MAAWGRFDGNLHHSAEPEQAHFKTWEGFVLKGHDFSRAEEGRRKGTGL
jgi:hypothetical protein